MNGDTIYDLDLRRKRQCFYCGIWYPAEYVEVQPEEGWDIDLNRPFYACKRCLDTDTKLVICPKQQFQLNLQMVLIRLVMMSVYLQGVVLKKPVEQNYPTSDITRILETNTSDTYLGEPK